MGKIGFIVLGQHKEPDSVDLLGRPFINRDLIQNAVESLERLDFEVNYDNHIVSRKGEALKALSTFKTGSIDCIILYTATWIHAAQIVGAVRDVGKPIIVWAPAESRGWPLVGALVLHGAFDEIGLKHKLIVGLPDDPETMRKIQAYVRATMVVNKLNLSTLGLIGGRGMGITVGTVDPSYWMSKFGVDIEHLDQYVLVQEAEKTSMQDVRKVYDNIQKQFHQSPVLDEVMEKSIRIYLAIKKIIKENGFDFTSLKCYPELSNNYCTACLAQSLLNDEGIVSSCEGDVNSAITSYILSLVSKAPVFSADIQHFRREDNVLKLMCDGAAPPSLAENPKQVKLGLRGLPTEGSSEGISVGLVCKPGTVTLARLFRIEGEQYLHISRGEVRKASEEELERELKDTGFPNWPIALVKLEGDVDTFIQNQRSEYTHMCHGDYMQELLDLCDLLDINPVVTA